MTSARGQGTSGIAFSSRGETQKNARQPEGAARSNSQMLDKLNAPDQQGVRDFLTEGVTSLSPLEMNRVLQNCGYENQRAVSERHMLVLSDLMKRGRWQPKSQIDFGVLNGRYILINGYHRAYAQVRSGKTITWSVALHHVRSDEELRTLYHAFDTNVRMRGSRDILKAVEFSELQGVPAEMAQSLYMAIPFLASKFATNPKDKNFLAEKQIDRRLAIAIDYAKPAARFAACIDGMMQARKQKFKGGGVTAVAVATFRYQSETAWTFWSGVAHNDGLKRGDPRSALVTDFLTRKGRGGSVDSFAPAILAWNAYFNEREMKIIKVLDSFVPVIDGTPFDGKPAKVA